MTRGTVIGPGFRTTQRVRAFFVDECGPGFRLDRAFRAWLTDGTPRTLGEAADHWTRGYARPRA